MWQRRLPKSIQGDRAPNFTGGVRRRRPAFEVLVLASQLLLMALAVAWCVHMVIIASNGRVYFTEPSSSILLGEIIATVLIALFAGVVFFMQFRRLG